MLANLTKIISLSVLAMAISLFLPTRGNNAANTALLVDSLPKEEVQTQEPIVLQAKAACVFDVWENKMIYELNMDTQLPLASLTKLMTAIVAKEYFPEAATVEIIKEALSQDGDNGLYLGEKWSLKDIMDVMLITSSNDAAFAIASSINADNEINDSEFVKLMNNKAKSMDLHQTYFLNATGLDLSETLAGAYGSCADVTNLVKYIFDKYSEVLEITSKDSLVINGREFKNTNKLLDKLPLLLAGKTGFDDLAGGNLTILVNKGLNHPIIITALGSTIDGRFEDVEVLYDRFAK